MRFDVVYQCPALSYFPPRTGSAPWPEKSIPYMFSPIRILCLHWLLGASSWTHSFIQGSGALGPGLWDSNTCLMLLLFFRFLFVFTHKSLLALTWLHWSSRRSSSWIHPQQEPTAQTPLYQTFPAAPSCYNAHVLSRSQRRPEDVLSFALCTFPIWVTWSEQVGWPGNSPTF